MKYNVAVQHDGKHWLGCSVDAVSNWVGTYGRCGMCTNVTGSNTAHEGSGKV